VPREARRMPPDAYAQADVAERDLRENIVRTCLRMVELGINQGTSGNVSARIGDRFLITPSGIPYDEMTPEQIAVMDVAGRYYGPCKPTTEWRIHREIMRARPWTGVVIHTHSVFSTTVACLRRAIPALHYYVAVGGGPTIRCADYATYGTQELADNVLAALADRDACLMANHGLLVAGNELDETLRRTFDIEILARQYVYALQAGEPYILPDDEIERVRLKMRTYGTQEADDSGLNRLTEPPG
jgi:L-fuculose-phosphate aldolase